MSLLDWLIHGLNFAVPALVVALVSAWASRVIWSGARAPSLLSQFAFGFVAGLVILSIGLWWHGVDGKMSTYGALVIGCAAVQWVLRRGWRR